MSAVATQIVTAVPFSFLSKYLMDSSITPSQQIISSCSGAILTSLFMTPLDVVKIRLQSQHKSFRTGSCFVYSNGLMDCLCVCSHCVETNNNGGNKAKASVNRLRPWYERPGHFSGTMDAFVKITRNEGIAALWSGLPPTLLISVPATVMYYTMYDRIKYALGYDERNPSSKYLPALAGAASRAAVAVLINPLEIVRTKMQSMPLGYRQLGRAIMVSTEIEGARLLLKGLGPSLLRDVPFSAIYWLSYEWFKARRLGSTGDSALAFRDAFLCGAAAGSIAGVMTTPFDVIKTHRQIELGEALVGPEGGRKLTTSTWALILRLYKDRGASALYAGAVPRLIKVAPACAIMISSYEFGKTFFRKRNEAAVVQNEDVN